MSSVPIAYRQLARAKSQRSGWRSALAAFLSFVFPGLGQVYNRDARTAIMLLLAVVFIVGGVVIPPLLISGSVIATLVDTGYLTRLLFVIAILLVIRLVAIIQAHLRRGPFSFRSVATYVTTALVVVTLAMHTVGALYAMKAVETVNSVARGGTGGGEGVRNLFIAPAREEGGVDELPSRAPAPSGSLPPGLKPPEEIEAPPADVPAAVPPPSIQEGERVNILVTGLDRRCGREAYTTDTMIVLSLDPSAGTAAMLTIRRDMWGVPLADGRTYDAKINSLLSVAERYPQYYPQGPVETLKGSVGALLDTPIHYFAGIDLAGFSDAIDAFGGVGVQVAAPGIDDPYYRNIDCQPVGFRLSPGYHHMDGPTALAYVRSRRGTGGSDYARAVRQQQVLTALRQQVSGYDLVASLPSVLDAVGGSVATDIPSSEMPVIADAVQRSNVDAIERVVLEAPYHMTEGRWNGQFIYVPNIPAIRAVAADLFD